MTTPLFSECLTKIRTSLAAGDTGTSDAILLALRICRTMFPEHRLKVLNRELLGYLEEELLFFHQGSDSAHLDSNSAGIGSVPMYRFVNGFWVPEYLTRQEMTVFSVGGSLTTKLFCNMGAHELELLMERTAARENAFVALKREDESGRVFLARRVELSRLTQAIRERVCHVIDELVGDLQMSAGS